jgi:hypothetical protein
MKINNRFKVLFLFLIAACLLAACGGTPVQSVTSAGGPKVDTNVVAFTGIVEAIKGTQWTVGGQTLTLDPQVSLDPNIAVGDQVKVEANVSADGSVVALKVESSAADDAVSTPSADANSTPDPVGTLSPDVSSIPAVSSTSDPSSTQAPGGAQNEIFGAVEAITADTITIDGVTYTLAQGFTEVKDILAVGDQVKLHVIVNADGSFTVREIEKSASTTVDDNSNNSNGSDDGPNHDINDDNSNSSGNGSDDGSNHDSNDDHGGSGGDSGSGDD